MSKSKDMTQEDTDLTLNMRMEYFCKHMTNLGSDTFSNQTKSYQQAGYKAKNPCTGASTLMRNPNVQTRIRQLHRENLDSIPITEESVINNIRYDRNKARQAGLWAVAGQLDKLEASTLTMFNLQSQHTVRIEQVPTLTDAEMARLDPQAKAVKLAIAGTGDGKPLLLPTAPIPGMTSYKPEQEAAFEPENSDNTDNAEVEEDKPEPEPEERVPYRGYMPPQRATHSTNEFS